MWGLHETSIAHELCPVADQTLLYGCNDDDDDDDDDDDGGGGCDDNDDVDL